MTRDSLHQTYNSRVNDKDLFDACAKLADVSAARLDFRRQLEWRLCLAIWAALAAGIAYFKVQQLPLWVGGAIVFGHGAWLQGIFVRHKEDTKNLWHFLHQAQAILARNGLEPIEDRPELRVGADQEDRPEVLRYLRNRVGFLFSWALCFQFTVTLVLTVIVYLVCAEEVTWWSLTPASQGG